MEKEDIVYQALLQLHNLHIKSQADNIIKVIQLKYQGDKKS